MSAARDDVAEELSAYLTSIGLDNPWSDDTGSSSRWLHSDDGDLYTADRLEFHSQLIQDELDLRPKVSKRSSLGVIVTAGPPGAGKSTALAAHTAFSDYRDVDADRFKDSLLLQEQATGTLDPYLSHTFSDQRAVSVRELSGFVHAESTTIANAMRDRCLSEGENIIIHGTLSSTDHTDELLQQLDLYGYTNLVIFDIEVSVERAINQALGRWWQDRIANPDGLGGRFVSPDTVRSQYPAGEALSNCAKNAQSLHDRADSLGWNVDLQTIHTSS